MQTLTQPTLEAAKPNHDDCRAKERTCKGFQQGDMISNSCSAHRQRRVPLTGAQAEQILAATIHAGGRNIRVFQRQPLAIL